MCLQNNSLYFLRSITLGCDFNFLFWKTQMNGCTIVNGYTNLHYGECELAPLMLSLGHNRDNRFYYFNPFVPNAPFLYPKKTSENRTVFFLYFQGVEKGCIENKWVKHVVSMLKLENKKSWKHSKDGTIIYLIPTFFTLLKYFSALCYEYKKRVFELIEGLLIIAR